MSKYNICECLLINRRDNTDDEDDNDELVAFSDVDYEDDDTEDDRLGKTNPLSASKTHWGEDSK